jgi:myxalamid-type polyketide synthase MxaB
MAEVARRLAGLSPAKRRLLEQRLKSRPEAVEPVAIVGMSCRFPGAPDIGSFWRVIEEGIDATGEIPESRWAVDQFYDPTGEQSGKMSTRWAGLIDGPDQFDPMFFGITPREANFMDPQQRLLLEVAWEAMEYGCLAPEKMGGSSTGVFVGIGGTDYSKIPSQFSDYYDHIEAYTGTGNALSIAANRLSYVFDFRGPSFAVDTACSSGLVGVHLALQALRNRECDAALAGAANMILSPETTIAFSRARMLSSDGKCRPFDASANGYVRGEGCGMLVLKRLTDAQRDGDSVLAVIRASAVNQDGRTSGITAPNALSQQRVLRAALSQAGLAPDQVSYIEAHGTGTPLGDPLEMQALAEVYRRHSADELPCRVTSVKANVGHLETVSGIAGLIKVVLMLQRRRIPGQLHLEKLNPNIKLEGTRLEIPTEVTEWESPDQPRIAGVSSFGFGGANTHVLVEEAQQLTAEKVGDERPQHLLTISAKTETALQTQAGRFLEFLKTHTAVELPDFCYSANIGRSDFNHRLAITADGREQMLDRLQGAAAGQEKAGVQIGQVRIAMRAKVAMVFTGQGSQYVGMGRELFQRHSAFRETFEELDESFRATTGDSLQQVLYRSNGDETCLHDTAYTQPALFAIEYALACLWRSWGVEPSIVLGHSVGEYVAACVAGVLTPEAGMQLVAHRARLMQQLPQDGAMAVVFTDPETVAGELAGREEFVAIAAANGPQNTVISGKTSFVEQLVQRFQEMGVDSQPLSVSHAFHSPLMDPMLDEFERIAGKFEFARPRIPIVSNLTGQLLTDVPPDASYWRSHVRNTVRFADGMRCLSDQGVDAILEVGPTPSLLGMGKRCLPQLEVAWLPSLRKGQDPWRVLLKSLAELYLLGVRIDWPGFDALWNRQRMALPTYPFERSRYWYRDSVPRQGLPVVRAGSELHPLIAARLPTALDTMLFETHLSSQTPAYLVDHQVQGSPVTPAAVYIEQALVAAQQVFGEGYHVLENISIQQAMFLPEGVRRHVQLAVSPESGGQRRFEIYSCAGENDDNEDPRSSWTLHACGTFAPAQQEADLPPDVDLDAVRGRVVSRTSREDFYQLIEQRGLAYGPAFQVLADLQRSERDALAQVDLPEAVQRELKSYQLHPALLDALFQSMAGAVPLEADGSYSPYTYMPTGVKSVAFHRPLAGTMYTYAVRTSEDDTSSPEFVTGNVFLVDEAGQVLVELSGVRVQRVGRSQMQDQPTDLRDWLYQIDWVTEKNLQDPLPQNLSGCWLILADRHGLGAELAAQLRRLGAATVLVHRGSEFASCEPTAQEADREFQIRSLEGFDYASLLETCFGVEQQTTCAGVVDLWNLDIESADDPTSETISSAREFGCASTLLLLQQLARFRFPKQPSLWVVTQGAQPVLPDESVSAVMQSAVWGLGRVAAMEHPEQQCRLLDLDPHVSLDERARALFQELVVPADEDQLAVRAGRRYVARLQRSRDLLSLDGAASRSTTRSIPDNSAFRLRLGTPGSFDSLWFEETPRALPAEGQVEIEVAAAGLNFSDVLKAMGLYPGIKDEVVPLGIECSGVVTATGPGVERLSVGDEVLGVAPYSFASHAISAEYALVPKPAKLDHQQASTIPVTFLTAYYGLIRLAQLSPGERVLIHAGAGGVGLAAIQIAQQVGAEIFATAGSEEKRDYLRSLGVDHVMNSRTLEFADHIMDVTQREGVDVVLNSLPGDAITKSLESLRAYGRFIEIGKTDIYQNRMIGLLPFQDNLSYFAIDLDRMLRQRPDYIRQMFEEVMDGFAQGTYQPLAMTQFSVDDCVSAFRFMAQRKNTGKVVVSLEDRQAVDDSRDVVSDNLVRPDGMYLVTGGTGSLGLRVADWLSENGASRVVLMSRRPPSTSVQLAIDQLCESGTQVTVCQGDVSDLQSLTRNIQQIGQEGKPLLGVFHAAGTLADGILFDMDLSQWDKAFAPKFSGAWNLHLATLDQPLDFFVMFSSVAAVLGSPGQGNYAAGNAFLDGLASYRRGQGLAATAINWGPWGDSGMAADTTTPVEMRSRGMNLLSPSACLNVMAEALRKKVANVAVMDVQWADTFRLLSSRQPALLRNLSQEAATEVKDTGGSAVDHEFRDELRELDVQQRQAKLSAYFADELASIMGTDPDELDLDQPLTSLGLDSLMAMELKNKIETRLMLNLPMARFLEGPSVNELAILSDELFSGDGPTVRGDQTESSAAQENAWVPLLALQAKGSEPPLFCIHPAGGDVRCYFHLARRMGEDRPVYVLRARGIDQPLPPHQSVPQMAADYLEEIRTIQNEGPYHLAGWSTGGIFAYEMVHQLQQTGAEVATLLMIDSPTPSIFAGVDLADDAKFLVDLINFSNWFANASMSVSYEELRDQEPDQRLRTVLDEAIKHEVVPPDVSTDHIRRLIDVCRAHSKAIIDYTPPMLAQELHIVRPEKISVLAEASGQEVAANLGWDEYTKSRMNFYNVPGDHFSMMTGENAESLARLVEKCLQGA